MTMDDRTSSIDAASVDEEGTSKITLTWRNDLF